MLYEYEDRWIVTWTYAELNIAVEKVQSFLDATVCFACPIL
jgi:hypothetical protein